MTVQEEDAWLLQFTAEAMRLNSALDRVNSGENATKVWGEFYRLRRGWFESECRFWDRIYVAARKA